MGAEGRDRRPEQLLQDQLVPSGLSALPSQWTHRGTCRQSSLSEFLEVDPASPVCHLAIPTQEHGCVKEKSALNAVKSSKDGFDQGCCDGRDWELNSEQRGGWGRVATGGRARGRASYQDERDRARRVVADATPTLLWYPDDLGSWQAAKAGRLSLIPL